MALLPITTIPHVILRTKTQDVSVAEILTTEFQKLITDMVETMHGADGIGLAAVQVGIAKRLCVVTTKDGVVAFINPRITKHSFRKEVLEEGCLSIPGVFGIVRRPKRIALTAIDASGNPLTVTIDGMFARIMQHEIDHLDGVLFTDKVITITKGERPNRT
ncbi:MAG: peptide deformylase [Patescibacteria group bacterium]